MCRSIKTLFNFDPPATDEEIREASLQFVRKLSGFSKPSKLNELVFAQATADVARVSKKLLQALETRTQPHNRQIEARRAQSRAEKRFGSRTSGVE